MRVCQSLICCLFLTALQDRDSLVDAETNIYAKREGEDITVRCYLGYLGSRKLLCKETCEEGNILIDTYGDEDQRGRYSIKYKSHPFTSSILDVTITKLTKSDSGWYRCKLCEGWSPDSEDNLKLIVTEASVTSAPTRTVELSPTTQISSIMTTTTTTTTATTTATTTRSLNSTSSSHQTKNQDRSGLLLYVGLTLVGLISMFSVALLIFCRSRRFKQKKAPSSETQCSNVTLPNQEYEEIRENMSPPLVISTVYSNVKYKKGKKSDGKHVYSVFDYPQGNVEDSSTEYSMIQFPNSTSPSSAPCGHIENDIYSSV
ncbi:uncharacterized protein LOC105354459 isoform X2 [Oryzias latipes]|uniref:uncharacterized protein LOC105354459 isoform X2 n=1 Tax=Oryzias latipes TaxID=8090 RepID=UPI000CE199EF|nr:uncharacterized protein LOC105354459 isoform X2 [Oryzias latipes]